MDESDQDFKLTEDTSIIEKKRPNFLLVLCILTFVGSGLGILMGLINFTGFNDVESTLNRTQAGNPFAREMFNDIDLVALQKSQDWVNTLSLLASVLCLAGAIIMFKLKKIGFVPYALGHAVAIFAGYSSLALLKGIADLMPIRAMGDTMVMVGGGTFVFTIIIAIAFLIMYGVNLKHLK